MSFCSSFRVRASSQLLSSRPSSRSAFSDTSHLPGPRHYTGRVPEYGTPAGSAVCDASTIHRRVGRRGPAPLRSHARRARWRADWLGGRPGVDEILIGKGERPVYLLPRYGNRHGLVAGATGTGKTISLMVMAEGFSRLGVPVFMADVKGDVAGLAMAGTPNEKIRQGRSSGPRDGQRGRSEPPGPHARDRLQARGRPRPLAAPVQPGGLADRRLDESPLVRQRRVRGPELARLPGGRDPAARRALIHRS